MFESYDKTKGEKTMAKVESLDIVSNKDFSDKIVNTLTDDIQIDGTMRFSKPTKIDCTFNGNITTESTLILGTKGNVTGNLKVGNVMVEGQLTGDIEASDKVILKNTCTVNGDITCPKLTMDEGCKYAGVQAIGGLKSIKDEPKTYKKVN